MYVSAISHLQYINQPFEIVHNEISPSNLHVESIYLEIYIDILKLT